MSSLLKKVDRLSVSQLGVDDIQPHNMGWGDVPRAMATVESLTPETHWALGERFTAADIVFGAWLDFATHVSWMKASPRVAAYLDRIRARPIYLATHVGWPPADRARAALSSA